MKKRRKIQWHRLDNAAKIFPAASSRTDTKVFRFACQLYEDVDQETLQKAIYETLDEFPVFRSVIKRGMFWYYLESSRIEPKVVEEYKIPCAPLFDNNEKKLLFEVTYFRKRINIEIHHTLTDGTGALLFFRILVMHYLKNRHEVLRSEPIELNYGASEAEKSDDSFNRYFDKNAAEEGVPKPKVKKVYQFKGQRLTEYRLRIIEGTMSLAEVLEKAHEYNTTLTIFLTSLMLCAINDEMSLKDVKKPVVIKVPVNLRTYFESLTARNFFGIIDVVYDFSKKSARLTDVISYVTKFFKNELTKEKLAIRMNALGALEKNVFLRSTPLSVKDFFMKKGYNMSNKKYTFSISNVGNIKMPSAFAPYIDMFDCFLSTDKQQACICSYGDKLRIGFTSPFVNAQLQKHFFRRLSQMGVSVTIETNPIWEEQEER